VPYCGTVALIFVGGEIIDAGRNNVVGCSLSV